MSLKLFYIVSFMFVKANLYICSHVCIINIQRSLVKRRLLGILS